MKQKIVPGQKIICLNRKASFNYFFIELLEAGISLKGSEVKSLVNKNHAPGKYNVIWDGTNNNGDKVAAGMYLYKIQSGNFTSTEKMIFLK